jgi:hypothetical protein
MGVRICSMIPLMIFLSFISVGCTGLTFVPIFSPNDLTIAHFDISGKAAFPDWPLVPDWPG